MARTSPLAKYSEEIEILYDGGNGMSIADISRKYDVKYMTAYTFINVDKLPHNTNKEAYKIKSREVHFRRKYGITLDKYWEMYYEQGGVCSLCGEPETQIGVGGNKIRELSVDHDHKTGEIRGLLCGECNLGIGNFRDDIIRLNKAIEYLKRFQ